MQIDGWTINREIAGGVPVFTATGEFDENGYRRTVPLLVPHNIDGLPEDRRVERFRRALKEALTSDLPAGAQHLDQSAEP